MKVLVFLLVFANLLFYAFGAGYFGHSENPDAGRVEQQVAPDLMRIVSRGEAPLPPSKPEPVAAEPVKPQAEAEAPKQEASKQDGPKSEASVPAKELVEAPAKKEEKPEPAPVCLVWRQLSVADADRLAALMGKRFKDLKVTRKTLAGEGNGWWTFVPPLSSKADADKKAAELQELGVKDFFVVQDGPNRFAISLGVFSTEKGSQDRLAELKAKGVRSATAAARPGKDNVVTLQAKGRGAEKSAVLAAVGDALPKADAQSCK